MSQPTDIQELVFTGASMVGASKERAIKEAFDVFFERGDWTEEDLQGLELTMEIMVDSSVEPSKETLIINGRRMVEFGRIESKIDIDGTCVQCLFSQSIKRLYSVGDAE